MRNSIYELVFTPDTTADEEQVELSKAAPPNNKALLLTCRQAYSEGKTLYQIAYRRCWKDTKFRITQNFDSPIRSLAQYRSIEIDINHITHLTIHCYSKDVVYDWYVADTRGSWECFNSSEAKDFGTPRVLVQKNGMRDMHHSKEEVERAFAAATEFPSMMEQLRTQLGIRDG